MAYALIQTATTVRTTYLLRTRLDATPEELRKNKQIQRLQLIGSGIFVFGFVRCLFYFFICLLLSFKREEDGSSSGTSTTYSAT